VSHSLATGRTPGRDGVVECMRILEVSGEPGVSGTAEAILRDRFSFLSEERELTQIDWSFEYVSPLWTYHLSYFDYAVDLTRAWLTTDDQRFGDRYVHLWTSWLEAAERGAARIEPYPTSVRCLNALRSLWLVEHRLPDAFADRLLGATHAQLAWLSHNLERHLRANHLQKNLTALAWGFLVFDGPVAATWERHLTELWNELREQVLPDGGHFERSPMYHAAALADFLRTLALCRAAGVDVPEDVPDRLRAMTDALRYLSRPDGTFHLLNDAANGERPSRDEVMALAAQVLGTPAGEPDGAFALKDTGYFGVIDAAAGHRLVIDAGPLGPSYQPGHAHCDMLSFELDLGGRPVVVDSGLHGYDGDPYREYVRSTRAHNTVAIDGRDQHEMWATFRVARRGEILRADFGPTGDGGFEFRGACRHYHDRRAVHHRAIVLGAGGLEVTDRVEGASGRSITSWLHLHPDFELEPVHEGFVVRARTSEPATAHARIEVFGVDEMRVLRGERDPVQGWFCPEFGLAIAAPVIEMRVNANDGRTFGYHLTSTGDRS